MNTNNKDQELADKVLSAKLKAMLRGFDEHDKKPGILDMIKDKGNNDFRHTCETIIRRQEEASILIGEVIDGSMPDPSDWDRLSDTVDEMDLLMRRLQRQIGDPR